MSLFEIVSCDWLISNKYSAGRRTAQEFVSLFFVSFFVAQRIKIKSYLIKVIKDGL